jgi:Fe-S-cluster-containing dehydrogenase component
MPGEKFFFIDPNRCIGCKACVEACSECDTHKGHSMIHLEYVDRAASPQTVPVICMHCDTPTCAEVCPADAIKRTGDGVLACPFGVPKMNAGYELMMKCDMCYDRTSVGKNPMCATVCPSRALHYGTWEEMERLRPRSQPRNEFLFGRQEVRTKVYMMLPRDAPVNHIDVLSAMAGTDGSEGSDLVDADGQLEIVDPMLASLYG